jgi:hypothetical protein
MENRGHLLQSKHFFCKINTYKKIRLLLIPFIFLLP